jgi:hypothetical protein
MPIISRRALREHWEKPDRGDSEAPLSACIIPRDEEVDR